MPRRPAHAGVVALMIALAAALGTSAPAEAAPGATLLIREAAEAAFRRSGREIADRVARSAVEQGVEAGVRRHGPRAAQAIADGGVELVEAVTRYGDDIMQAAIEASPNARRVLALEPGRMMPLVRELGTEAVEIEAKAPGLARRVFASFGTDGGRQIAAHVPAEDLPRLLAYADKADTPQTRLLLLEVYKKEGDSLFRRIPASLVLSTGLSASMLYATHRATAPLAATGNAIRDNPHIAREMAHGFLWIAGVIVVIVAACVLGSLRLLPWQTARRHSAGPADGSSATAATSREAAAAPSPERSAVGG